MKYKELPNNLRILICNNHNKIQFNFPYTFILIQHILSTCHYHEIHCQGDKFKNKRLVRTKHWQIGSRQLGWTSKVILVLFDS